MTTKTGLITDSFKVVKRARRGRKREKSVSPPPAQTESEDQAQQEENLSQLREFDLEWRFGPCVGISRLQRWERAKLHGLNPPDAIKELLLQGPTDPQYTQSVWSEYPL